ncbi:MAG: PD40 domain-containing protein [Acidobacteria bacterium]|nr:PD40 domain-containing protein [Acidobacteriota bacterium]
MFRPGPPRDRLDLPERFSLLEVEVDLAAARALRAGEPLPLEPKAFDLLLLLAANPGRVVEKQEIFERIWPDAVVTDNALSRVVAHLRRELGDDAEAPRFVETVRTRGYRAIAEPRPGAPEAQGDEGPPDRGTPSQRSGRDTHGVRWALAATALALAAVLAWLLAPREAGEKATTWVASPELRTFERGYNGGGDFSPDGSQIVYSSDAAGGLELFVRPLEGGPARQITSGGGTKVDAAWSPDGRAIAYRDATAGGLWLVSPTGGAPRQLADFGAQPAWFPDGRTLVFSQPGSPTIGGVGWPATYLATLWTLDLDSGRTRELTHADPEFGGHGMPAVSPDGNWVYYATGRLVGGGALFRVPATGGSAERLTAPTGDREFWYEPTPAPDGRALFAISAGLSVHIVRLPLEAGALPEPILAPAPDPTTGLALARDGRRLLYTEASGEPTLEEVELDAGGAAKTVGAIAATRARRLYFGQYSPDGSRLIYWRIRPGAEGEAVVVERETGAERVFDIRRGRWTGPTTYTAVFDGGSFDLDVESGRKQPRPSPAGLRGLLERGRPRTAHVSRDLRWLALTAAGSEGGQELFLGDTATGEAVQRTRFGRPVDFPVFSANGRWLAMQVGSTDGASNEIWLQAREGGEPERLPTGEGPSWGATFAPDDREVAYAAYRGGAWYLAIAGPGEPERRLEIPPETSGYLRWPDWSPDGRHIAYERMHYTARLWTLDLPPSP